MTNLEHNMSHVCCAERREIDEKGLLWKRKLSKSKVYRGLDLSPCQKGGESALDARVSLPGK